MAGTYEGGLIKDIKRGFACLLMLRDVHICYTLFSFETVVISLLDIGHRKTSRG